MQAHERHAKDFEVLKWTAIMSGEWTSCVGTKERIEEGVRFKGYLDAAIALQPRSFECLHMRGRFAFSVCLIQNDEKLAGGRPLVARAQARLGLLRDAAHGHLRRGPRRLFGGKREQIKISLQAYELKPEWQENVYYTAKTYIAKGDRKNAAVFLEKVVAIPAHTKKQQEIADECQKLLPKYK